MPRRTDIRRILLVGSGPIVIGQGCEFDYSGTQGAKALKQEGYEVILVNSNPATVMTDPEFADRTYIEPLVPEVLEAIIARERPDALLPTLGGQTGLNLAINLAKSGYLQRHNVTLLGANVEAILKAEDREQFKQAMERIGLRCPKAHMARTVAEANDAVVAIGFPVILRPSFTLGGSGGGIAYNREEFDRAIRWAFQQSPTHECLIEESVLGWKEFELEVIRDCANNFAVICTIENFDPMGVHTGDSITVAPAMTLTDREYQRLRDAARAIIAEIGVDTGGSNIQFAVNPKDGAFVVIEMNPRVSRSSALASKATGYPIAKIAAKLAVGYRLDELKNDITQTSAAFEPSIDYVVCKVPRFAFEKFPGSDIRLTTQMKSVGEAMAIGRTFKEALHKATRSLEIGRDGLVSLMDKVDYRLLARSLRNLAHSHQGSLPGNDPTSSSTMPRATPEELKEAISEVIRIPVPDRLWHIADAFRVGLSLNDVHTATAIDPWFLREVKELIDEEETLRTHTGESQLARAKAFGFSDSRIATLKGVLPSEIRAQRERAAIRPSFLRVDSCAAEFPALTPYMYSSYGAVSEEDAIQTRKIMILGGGPNRIGQGIEFDYCCVHAAFALAELGYETIMVNCNPETVSTDYDTSDRLYFEPLTFEDVMAIVEAEKPEGVIVQFGGQTPLKLSVPLEKAGVRILGTSASAIDRAEDREKFEALLQKLDLRRPPGGIARSVSQAFEVAGRIGYPLLVRPSYVLGGRAMQIVHSHDELAHYITVAVETLEAESAGTILLDQFLKDAIEVDVDCLSDGTQVVIGGIMQHIEEAGVHSGDSTSVLPAHSLSSHILHHIREATRALALELGVVGLMNVQFAVYQNQVYVLEVNPRASRTVPFVSKVIGVPLAKIAAQVMAGKTLAAIGFTEEIVPTHVGVKESVFPFVKFAGVDTILGPEMRSTGEVMGIADNFAAAFSKAMLSAGMRLPQSGTVFISVRDEDKEVAHELGMRLSRCGFRLVATCGTSKSLAEHGISAERVHKVTDGHRPNIVDLIHDGEIHIVINTTSGAQAIRDSYSLRRQTVLSGVPYFTTIAAARAVVDAIEAGISHREVKSLQEYTQQGPASARDAT
ncbi:MAG: carbamoyl-phosphate synthase large subunit [Myxococcales bacterium]|nr:carbamoyl-phosphate synthase large subunit [Myxococcales bacterium]